VLKLHGVDPAHFLAHHWQRAPLLLRGALPGYQGWLERDHILELAGQQATPSRFIATGSDVVYGPLALDNELLEQEAWTVLVQSLETVFDDAWALLDAFDFLPRTSLDDVMVSFAAPGGGVGPHLDRYGVFLVQASGQRRWRYASRPIEVDDDTPLAPWPFEADHDEVLEPGDVLYLPPGVPHDGVAVGDCITYSLGAAAPRYADLMPELLAFLAMDPAAVGVPTDGMFEDMAGAGGGRATLPRALTGEVLTRVRQLTVSHDVTAEFIGRLLTAPKPHTLFQGQDAPDLDDLQAALDDAGRLRLRPASRMLAEGDLAFLNGEAFELGERSPWRELAERRVVDLPLVLDDDDLERLAMWIEAGFVELLPG
jgi:50S ribosomal protein L16 3-hydroxylase